MTLRPVLRPARRRGDGGAALVEFAIVLPFLVMLVFGIYAVGQGYHAKTELTGAVREGARAAALHKDPTAVTQAVIDASPGLRLPAANVVVWARPSATDQWVRGDCRTAGMVDAKVEATYNVPYSIPVVSSGTWTIDEQAVMRCEA